MINDNGRDNIEFLLQPYESFVQHSESDQECFISIYDNSDDPENYLEVTYSPKDADTVSAFISEALLRNMIS